MTGKDWADGALLASLVMFSVYAVAWIAIAIAGLWPRKNKNRRAR